MEEKELTQVTPATPKKIHLVDTIQPNSVTTARYNFNSVQEDILTLMYTELQDHLSKKKKIQTDLFGSPQVTFDYTKVKSGKNRQHYIKHAEGMVLKSFAFDYTTDKNVKTHVNGTLVTTVIHSIDNRDPTITLVINPWAIPYLLYWGTGIGGTFFSPSLSLSLRSIHAKSLYKICCRHRKSGGFGMFIDDFKEDLRLKEGTYTDSKSLSKLLKRAQKELQEQSDINFEFKFTKKGGSKVHNWINFKVVTTERFITKAHRTDMWTLIYDIVSFPYPSIDSDKAMRVADKFSETPELQEAFYRRCKKMRNEFNQGEIEKQDVIRLVKYILKNDYGM